MQHLIISALAGLAGYSFVRLAPWWFSLRNKPFNCQMCMAFWFGIITSILVETSFYAPAVGFGAMWFAAMGQKTLEQ
jgi:hypothetical protein